jgi:hypothetical protein
MLPLGTTWWSFDKILPTSVVSVAKTSTLQSGPSRFLKLSQSYYTFDITVSTGIYYIHSFILFTYSPTNKQRDLDLQCLYGFTYFSYAVAAVMVVEYRVGPHSLPSEPPECIQEKHVNSYKHCKSIILNTEAIYL